MAVVQTGNYSVKFDWRGTRKDRIWWKKNQGMVERGKTRPKTPITINVSAKSISVRRVVWHRISDQSGGPGRILHFIPHCIWYFDQGLYLSSSYICLGRASVSQLVPSLPLDCTKWGPSENLIPLKALRNVYMDGSVYKWQPIGNLILFKALSQQGPIEPGMNGGVKGEFIGKVGNLFFDILKKTKDSKCVGLRLFLRYFPPPTKETNHVSACQMLCVWWVAV